MTDKDYPTIIRIAPPEGEAMCDVCNKLVASNYVALETICETEWGLYCSSCALKYKDEDKAGHISGYKIKHVFFKDEAITF